MVLLEVPVLKSKSLRQQSKTKIVNGEMGHLHGWTEHNDLLLVDENLTSKTGCDLMFSSFQFNASL